MAVFMLNVCKFNGCGLTFKSLGHLIQHIEETHIDYDPQVVEQTEQQQPTCIPLSYALRFLTDAARKEATKPIIQGRLSQTSTFAASTRNRNNAATTPTGSEAEEGDEFVSEPEDSNDSWTTSEEFSADFILRYGSRVISPNITTPVINHNNSNTTSNNINNNNNNDNGNSNSNSNNSSNSNPTDKPFACPVPGCKKRYKNVNGIKYHSKNGHKNDGKIRKAFRCPCGKSYKTPYGLKNHAAITHAGTVLQIKLLQNGKLSSTTRSENSQSNHHHHHHHRENCTKNVATKLTKHSLTKAKVAAIEDHGYIKSEKPVFTDSEVSTGRDCEDDDLGILTPASTPPLSTQSPVKNDNIAGSGQQDQQERSLHKYLANVVASSHNGQHRRNVVDNNNAY